MPGPRPPASRRVGWGRASASGRRRRGRGRRRRAWPLVRRAADEQDPADDEQPDGDGAHREDRDPRGGLGLGMASAPRGRRARERQLDLVPRPGEAEQRDLAPARRYGCSPSGRCSAAPVIGSVPGVFETTTSARAGDRRRRRDELIAERGEVPRRGTRGRARRPVAATSAGGHPRASAPRSSAWVAVSAAMSSWARMRVRSPSIVPTASTSARTSMSSGNSRTA